MYLFGGFIGGNLTLITVVLTINQLVLSRQLRSPGELRTQIQQIKEYRAEIEERTDAGIAPAMPAAFLAFLLQSTRQQAQALEEMTANPDSQRLQTDIEDLTAPITEQIDQILDRIDDPELGIFEVLLPLLMTNYAEAIYDARQIRQTYQEALSNETATTINGLIEDLEQIDVARQYFKTVYIQQELAILSRFILYVGIPAELTTVAMLLLFLQPANAAVALQLPSFLIVAAIAVGFAPLSLLVTFVLRIATVAYRTAAITPFTTPGQES
ncbi:hypothetical protein [Haladaptatus salinisoli]|uniref:hypothetical protein n=1 Tax=Haladaptatus salinisoli TaxID=2884876 RepID=UPI001D0A521C|nr:hypothetical protein [Haladaptatus salinisoli]